MVIGYVLKCDIRHYFASVDHNVLLDTIGRKIKDKGVLWLVGRILRDGSGKGMPIGALTSQLFANIYLNELDCFVKHKLRTKHYIRYMDDFLILHESKEELARIRAEISGFLPSLKVELHPEKSRIFPLNKGVCFLGYRIFSHYKLLKRSNIRLMDSRMAEFKILHDEGIMTYTKSLESLESWMSYARYADSYKTRRRVMGQFNRTFSVSFLTSA